MSQSKQRKIAIREVLQQLADVAEAAGMPSSAHDIRQVRIPKLDEGRFSLVVLGEFNHGKSTFINALLTLADPWGENPGSAPVPGSPILPVGITPTTAVLTLIRHGQQPAAQAVFENGQRQIPAPDKLADWLTVSGASSTSEALAHVELE